MIHGNTTGLKPSQVKALERLYRRRLSAGEVISPELARSLTELSWELRRQVGLIIDRSGEVKNVILGDDHEIVIPDLSGYGLGRSGLRGLRCIHTHLKGEPLSQDDLNDLALLRLDMMIGLAVGEDGLPGPVYSAHLIPPAPDGRIYMLQTIPRFTDGSLTSPALSVPSMRNLNSRARRLPTWETHVKRRSFYL